jgi:cellulose synthase operon protein C
VEKDELLEYLETRLRDNPKSLLFARLADQYLKRGNTDDALVLCTEGVRHHPYYTTGYFLLARTHVLRKEYDKAEAALKKVLSHDQQYLAAQKLLGDILVKTGWEAAASEHYASVVEADPMEEKVRDLVTRYAVPVDAVRPAPPAAGPIRTPVPEPDPLFGEEPEAPVPNSGAAAPPEPVSSSPDDREPMDWTEQIREFSPEDVDLPVPPYPAPAEDDAFPAGGGPASVDRTTASDEPKGLSVEALPPLDVEIPLPAVGNGPALPAAAEPGLAAEEVVDFTQNWFDLSSFDNLEDAAAETPAEPAAVTTAEKNTDADLDLELPDAEPETPAAVKPAAPLFEKKEPEPFLAPAEPEPAKPVPWFKTDRQTASKTPPPEPSGPPRRAAVPAPPVPPEAPAVPRGDDRPPEPKIVTSTLGEIYAAQGQFEKAIEVYEALLEKSPKETRYKDKIADLRKRLKEASGK